MEDKNEHLLKDLCCKVCIHFLLHHNLLENILNIFILRMKIPSLRGSMQLVQVLTACFSVSRAFVCRTVFILSLVVSFRIHKLPCQTIFHLNNLDG